MKRLLREGSLDSLKWWSDFEWSFHNCPNDMYDNVLPKLLGSDGHFEGGIWELYLWKQFHDAGAEIKYETKISDGEKTCDFEVVFPGGEPILVEATHVSHEPLVIRTKWREEDLRIALSEAVDALGFYISTRVDKTTDTTPNFSEILIQVKDWIEGIRSEKLHPENSLTVMDSSGWELTFDAHPIPEGGALAFTGSATFPDDASRYRAALENKLKKFEAHSGSPVIIAVSLNSEWWRSGTFERFSALVARPAISIDRETREASPIFTDPWTGLHLETYSQGVSAVLFGSGDFPGFDGRFPLDLWLNYTATRQVDETSFPIARLYHRVTEDCFFVLDRDGSAEWEPANLP